MDGSRFDTLARQVESGRRSRRVAFRLLGSIVGAMLAAPDSAQSRKRKRKKRCRRNGQTCESFGKVLGKCCANSSCQEVPHNQSKYCLCKTGFWDPNRTGFCVPIDCLAPQETCDSATFCCQTQLGQQMACASINPNKGPRGCGFVSLPNATRRCCLGEGSSVCQGDCDCCGDLTCQEGRCRPPKVVCLPLESTCTSEDQCCGGNTLNIACDFVDPFKGTRGCGRASEPNRCCTTQGWQCQNLCECCGSMTCDNGTCKFSSPGQRCVDSAQCEFGMCQVAQPKPDGSCLIPANEPPPQLCCVGEGAPCTSSCSCCGTLVCVNENGVERCRSIQGPPCATYGAACRTATDCCDNVPCVGNMCRFN